MTRIRSYAENMVGKSTRAKIFFAISFFMTLALCFTFVYYVWEYSLQDTKGEALTLASVAETGIRTDSVKALEISERDLSKQEYGEIKKSLANIVAAHQTIRFAYLLVQKNGKIYIAADSEPVDSVDYSPPGQEYTEVDPRVYQPFRDGVPLIIDYQDRWGTWVTVMIPVKDQVTQEIIALYCVDYTVDMWYQYAYRYSIQAAVVAACILLLYFAVLAITRTNISIRQEKRKLAEANEKLSEANEKLSEANEKQYEINAKLQESERSYALLLSNLPGMAYRCRYDRELTILFASEGCYELTGYPSSHLVDNKMVSYNEIVSAKYRSYLQSKWEQAVSSRTKLEEEYELITASGAIKWVFEQGQAIYDESGNVESLEGLIIDITDRKKKEEEIIYLNYHDFLTGIYNRRFLEQVKSRFDREDFLPLTVLIGDINGVKLVNDAFGHAEGDILIRETAQMLKSCCREGDIVSRTGGDEFTILMPLTDQETANGIMESIKAKCREYNQKLSSEAYSINISLGFATKETMQEHLDTVIKLAEDFMYKRKLLEHKSSHSAILSSIKATMHERSHETQEHAERLTYLSKELGKCLRLTQQELDELELIATLHDIGKVGIDDRILNKPGKLNEEEWIEMKKHSEIGYRIAMSSPDLVPVADDILSLHERWDGSGYPQGIKGEEIPLLSRIVQVVDAYDAMTEDRAYRNAMTEAEAAAELRRNAGTQFDPKIVKPFLDKVLPAFKAKNEKLARPANGRHV